MDKKKEKNEMKEKNSPCNGILWRLAMEDNLKIREVLRRQRQNSEDEECPDIDFQYDDEDCFANEISELYSYTEIPEYNLNQISFDKFLVSFKFKNKCWRYFDAAEKRRYVMNMSNMIDNSKHEERLNAIRAILYLCQGCWLECQSDAECFQNIRDNVELLYDCGIFVSFIELLDMEIESQVSATNAWRKLAVNIVDSIELRIILSVLYTMVHVLRTHPDETLRTNFRAELNSPIRHELIHIRLLNMVTKFCSDSSPHFPMKKVLLLLWKVILTSLGGFEELRKLKDTYREKENLPAVKEDTMTISKTMRPVSPPLMCAEFSEGGNNTRKNNTNSCRQSARKLKSSKQHKVDLGMNPYDDDAEENYDSSCNGSDTDKRSFLGNDVNAGDVADDQVDRVCVSSLENSIIDTKHGPCMLPWAPKVKINYLDQFIDYSRLKFIGYSLPDDRTTLAGLPDPIHEAVKILKKHLYTSLSEKQIERENEILRCPMLNKNADDVSTPAESLYKAMLPSLPQYIIALLKILLAASPTSKTKTDSINIMTDVLPEDIPLTLMQSMKLGIDVNRHKEIIIKAVSAIILLLLKHFKVNHIYQFEFMSQHLVFANCIPLVLKFFNQKMIPYITSKNNIALLDFPSCVIGEQPEFTTDTIEIGDTSVYSWRIMFSCVNLLRILNKLTKWKHSRIMILVAFKSTQILKKTLKVKHAMFQLYVLKLLKMQTKYLGRNWRKTHMRTLTSIYTQVRHHLNDDWAYGVGVESRPWDLQAEECTLRAAVDRFNNRRYEGALMSQENDGKDALKENNGEDFYNDNVDNCISSILSQEIELTGEFKKNYEKWLNREVFKTEIKWELLLEDYKN